MDSTLTRPDLLGRVFLLEPFFLELSRVEGRKGREGMGVVGGRKEGREEGSRARKDEAGSMKLEKWISCG